MPIVEEPFFAKDEPTEKSSSSLPVDSTTEDSKSPEKTEDGEKHE
jgi:hypothetical protein